MADTLRLRPVTPADARLLFQWVNDAEVRAHVLFRPSGELAGAPGLARNKLASNAGTSRSDWMWMAEASEGREAGLIRFEAEDAARP